MTPALTPDMTLPGEPRQAPQQLQSAPAPPNLEPTKNNPSQTDPNDAMLQKYGPKLLTLIAKKRREWEWKRRPIVQTALKNKEMLKGNQHIGIVPGTFETFDAFEEYNNWTGAADDKNADRSMDKRPHNFYQMVEKAFGATLSEQIPKARATPMNADVEDDRTTEKAFDRIMEIIERANKVQSMLRQELMEFFTSGCYFKFTRYVVDPDRTGTHKENFIQMTQGEIMPARYQCFKCGMATPEDALVARSMKGPTGEHSQLACPNCGSKFGPENYMENHVGEVPVMGQREVANGMVLWSIYGPLHVDTDPDAHDLLNACLLNVAEEPQLGWMRQTFPKFWEKLQPGMTTGGGADLLDRQYRDMLSTPSGYGAAFYFTSQNKPTYNRTWCQPMLFAEMETKAECDELTQAFPKGCMIAWTGEIPLRIRPAKLTEEWTWAGTEQKGFGMYPAPVGNPAVPIQERINDCISKIDEYMDRLACGILLANEMYIDTKNMNGKAMLPGVLNPIAVKNKAALSDINNMIFQVKGEIDATIFQYVSTLKQDIELLVGTPPQTFGAGTQEGVDTMGGQQMQQQAGMTKMGLYWDVIREEHAEAEQNAVLCASRNMTDDWLQSVSDESKEFLNQYVHLDEVKGSVHVEPDTDQGFPMTAAEIRKFWMDVMSNAESAATQLLMQEPANVDACVRSLAVPGLVAPQGAMRGKMLRTINQLVNGQATPGQDPISGEPMQIPSVQPNKYLDDLSTLLKLIPRWAQEHWDQLESNPGGLDNLVAYFQMCVVYERELVSETHMFSQAGQPPATAGAGAQA
jgi:hypothetical protein